jgi:hypothetical protein
MQHSFDISIAEKYDVNVAIFLNNLGFWIKKNQANKKHFHNGRYWTYNSSEALSIIFPYWSSDQMDRLIKKCVSLGLLLLDNFNETSYDRTRWYGLTDLALELLNFGIPRNHGMDSAESRNRNSDIAEPIPDNKPDNKPDKIKDKRGKKRPPALTPVPVHFISTEKHALQADMLNLNVGKELIDFIEYYRSTGKKMANWDAAFSRWLKKAVEFNKKSREKEHPVTASIRQLKEKSADFRNFLLS